MSTSKAPSSRAALVAAAAVIVGLSLGLGLAGVSAGDASAQGKPPAGKKAPKPPPPEAPPARAKKPVAVSPAAISWGMSPAQVASVYDKLIDDDFRPRYKKVQPGPTMTALDAEVAEAKAEVRRSLVRFGDVPTGYDATPLKPEYSYANKESVMNVTRDGRERYFFFLQDKLWKVVDEHKLGEGKPWGKTFDEALGKLAAYYAIPARLREPSETNGLLAKEGDWSDGKSHVRAIERSETGFALLFEDEATVAQLPSLRTNKPRDANAMDPGVTDILRKEAPPPGPPPEKDGKKPSAKK